MKHLLIYPMAFYVFYIFCLLTYAFRTRVRAIKSGKIDPKYFKAYLGPHPDELIVVGRHYDNQFQAPLLFLVTCTTHLIVDRVNMLTLFLAWLFIATRVGHSWVHLGKNKLQKRVLFFAAGWSVILMLWVQLLFLI